MERGRPHLGGDCRPGLTPLGCPRPVILTPAQQAALRDLLMVLRDIINAMIERIDNRRDEDFRVEEIPID